MIRLTAGLVSAGPIVLVITGVVALVFAFVDGSVVAVGIAAALIALGVLLPRLYGKFKFGAQGIEGNLREQVFREVKQEGQRAKLPAERVERALRAVQEAVPDETSIAVGPARLTGSVTTVIDETEERIAHYIAQGVLYEDLPPIRQCFKCGEFVAEPEDGMCPKCGMALDR